METGEEAQEAKISLGTESATTSATAAEDCDESSQPHACSRAGSQVETPAREAKGSQPQDP